MTEDEEFEFRLRYEQEQAAPAAAAAPEKPGYGLRDLAAPWDAGLHVATGMAAAPVAGLAGLAASPFGGERASDIIKSIQERLTYQPRTRLGGEMADVAGKVLEIPARIANAAGEATTDATGSPAAGTAANVAVQAIPALLGSRGVAGLRGRAANLEELNSVRNQTMREATDAGYVAPPSELATGPVSRAVLSGVEGLTGRQALQSEAAAANQAVTTAGARQNAAIPGRGQIEAADIADAIAPHVAVYEQARAVSPRANAAVEGWRDANAEAKAQRLYYQRSANPEAQRAATAAQTRADAYARVVEREAVAAGQPELVTQLRAARVSLGRIGSVERALNESTGEVSAQRLRQQQDAGAPLGGELATAAGLSRATRNRMTADTQPVATAASASPETAILAAMLRGGAALTGIPIARWLGRRALLSRPAQLAARPGNPLPPLTRAEQMQRAALIAALQQQQE